RPPRLAAGGPMILLLAAWTAFAGDTTPPPSTPAPPIAVVGFEARSGGSCADRTAARNGTCVDVVDFFPLSRAAGPRRFDPVQRVALTNIGSLYGHVWDDLAFRWNAPDIIQTLRDDGYTSLPMPASTWERGTDNGHAWALPSQASVLGDGQWYLSDAAPDAP